MVQIVLADTQDPTLATAMAMSLEAAINAALTYDPGTRTKLRALAGKHLNIHTSQPALFLQLSVAEDQLQLSAHPELEATTTLEGKLLSVIGLVFSSNSSLANSGVTVSGQVGLLEQYQYIFNDVDIDWEDALSSVIGDLPAHQLALAGNAALDWFRSRSQRAPRFINEFLTEELRAIPAQTELNNYSEAVDRIRQQTDRLEAKINHLGAVKKQQ
jgi:Uncharacterized protein conserved in bacteria